ncbi:putative ephrin type-A receptor 3 [Apostichopus japonicus]|uniref:Putative ephrin type-A receptor 3 n=1 Tax=Stichopus japonicus TaxID=307972 RepID=A0A2G8JQG8_STIJA|nr:putative ephrin type-A receptor 3 [Apostichopus japonicus]
MGCTQLAQVPPTMFLQVIDSKNVAIVQWVEQQHSITVICNAVAAKPRMSLSWTIGNERKNASSSSVTNDTTLFNTTSILHHVPTNEQEYISCTANFDGHTSGTGYNKTVMLNTYVVPTDLSIIINGQDSVDTVHLTGDDNLVKVTFRSFGGRPNSSLSCKLSDPNSSMTDMNISGIQDYTRHGNIFNLSLSFSFCFGPKKLRSSVLVNYKKLIWKLIYQGKSHYLSPGELGYRRLEKKLHEKKPKSELPDIPTGEQISQHSGSSESNYYSATKDSPGRERMFNEKDICLVLKMKKGRIYDRWMGTITVSRDVSKCGVLTALGDSVVKNKDVHWDDFVKRTLDLPQTDHLVKIEGIGIEKSFLYLITEHLVCDPLDSLITSDSSAQGELSSTLSVTEVMKMLAGILEGMEVLKSYGFLHPGLSTKKILYTKQGQCKLYDFCLAEDAPKIIAFKKTQESRHFAVDKEIKPGDTIIAPNLLWPERFLQLRNFLLFDCWSENCSLRPSIHQLRASFKTIFEKLIDHSFYEIPMATLYTPMVSSCVEEQ